MTRYDQHAETQIKNDLRVEFGQELGFTQPLDTQYERGSLSLKEYGSTKKRLLELGGKVFKSSSKDNK